MGLHSITFVSVYLAILPSLHQSMFSSLPFTYKRCVRPSTLESDLRFTPGFGPYCLALWVMLTLHLLPAV